MNSLLPHLPKKLVPIPGRRLLDDQALAMVIALASESMILRARLDTCERLLVDAGILPADAVETYVFDAAAEAERARLRQASMDKIFRALSEAADVELASLERAA